MRWCGRLVLAAVVGTALAAPAGALEIGLEPVAEGLVHPVALVSPPGDPRRFVAEQIGRIRLLADDGALRQEPFLDIRDRLVEVDPGFDERGLLGIAFPPDFARSGQVFVYYSAPLRAGAPAGWDHTARLSAFQVMADDPDRADPASERIVLEIDQPDNEHNGGSLSFGPDGYLHLGLGDGGLVDEDLATAGQLSQAPDSLLGKVLRLDVACRPYCIPPDNPFVGDVRYRPEVFALGLRNPYRCTFDDGHTGALVCGDVGLGSYEEVNVIRAGGNYGWPHREGRHCFDSDDPFNHPPACEPQGLIDPALEYVNCSYQDDCVGRSIIGGYVYRGRAIPELAGRYVFGDWAAVVDDLGPSLFVATPGPGTWAFEPLPLSSREFHAYVLGFGEDAAGELYVLSSQVVGPDPETPEGTVYRIVPRAIEQAGMEATW